MKKAFRQQGITKADLDVCFHAFKVVFERIEQLPRKRQINVCVVLQHHQIEWPQINFCLIFNLVARSMVPSIVTRPASASIKPILS